MSMFEVTTFYSLDEYGLRYRPKDFFVCSAPKTPVNRVRLYRLGVRLTSMILELKQFGFDVLPDLQLSTVANLDHSRELKELLGGIKCP